MPGTTSAPAASRAKVKKHTSKSPRVRRNTRHSRTRMVLTAYGALSPVNRAFLPPSPAQCASIVAGLMPASRHQDHTLSPSASHLVVCRRGHVHRIPCPTFRDDREAPLVAGRDARISSDDLPDGLSEIFLERGLDGQSEAHGVICPSGSLERAPQSVAPGHLWLRCRDVRQCAWNPRDSILRDSQPKKPARTCGKFPRSHHNISGDNS